MLVHWNNSPQVAYPNIRTHYPDYEPTTLCSNSLMLRTYRRSSRYKLYSLWFYLTTWPRLEPTIYHTRGNHANHYTTWPRVEPTIYHTRGNHTNHYKTDVVTLHRVMIVMCNKDIWTFSIWYICSLATFYTSHLIHWIHVKCVIIIDYHQDTCEVTRKIYWY